MASIHPAYPYSASSNPESQPPPSPSGSALSGADSSSLVYDPLPIYNSVQPPPYSITDQSSAQPRKSRVPASVAVAHPYARLFAKKEEVKRRKIWNHALEKSLFSPYEISTIGAPQRRTIYIASLEAHIDKLHAQLLDIGFWPVAFDELAPYRGLNSKTAKSMVSGLQHDASVAKLKLLELERANQGLKDFGLQDQPPLCGDSAQPATHFNYYHQS